MINSMRKKFTLVALLSTILVLVILIGGINLFNFSSIKKDVNMRLMMISDNDGVFPGSIMKEKADDVIPDGPMPPMEPMINDPGTFGFFGPGQNMPAEAAFNTRYFSVTLSKEGEVKETDVTNIYAVNKEKAEDMAKELFDSGKKEGFYGNYGFLRTDDEDITYTFLDCERDLNTFYSFLKYSVLISVIGTVLIAILIWSLSGIVVRPMAESYEKQKRFITDAGHELKTPLTIIDANTEVIETEAGESEWTESIHHQIERLSDLVNKLVLLSRMDEEATRLEMIDFDLSEAVSEIADDFSVVAAASGKKMDTDIDEGIVINGDKDKIKQVVGLLLDNAVKYSASESEIKVMLKKSGKNVKLSVANEAEGLKKGSYDELFERFYRGDSSHNQQTGGHGIGLSVAKAIISKHKGKIKASSPDGKNMEFTVTL